MEILDKKGIREALGKNAFASKAYTNVLISQLKYLGGLEVLDQRIDNKLFTTLDASFQFRPKGLELYLLLGFKNLRVPLFFDKIKYWAVEPQEDIYVKKSKSLVGRALLGGALFGPVGAIVGGMTGLKDEQKRVNEIDNVVTIGYDDNGKDVLILFACKHKKLKDVMDFFSNTLPDKLLDVDNDSEDIGSLSIEVTTSIDTLSNETSIADELLKLKELLDAGLLTKEEFEQQKARLLQK